MRRLPARARAKPSLVIRGFHRGLHHLQVLVPVQDDVFPRPGGADDETLPSGCAAVNKMSDGLPQGLKIHGIVACEGAIAIMAGPFSRLLSSSKSIICALLVRSRPGRRGRASRARRALLGPAGRCRQTKGGVSPHSCRTHALRAWTVVGMQLAEVSVRECGVDSRCEVLHLVRVGNDAEQLAEVDRGFSSW